MCTSLNTSKGINKTPKTFKIINSGGFNSIKIFSGELGIRTPGTFNSSTVFKTAAIDHSASSPGSKVQNPAELTNLNFFFLTFLILLI